MTAAIVAAITAYRYRFTNEVELQDGIARALTEAGIPFTREMEFPDGSRIDFLCGAVGVEIKIHGHPAAVTRQLFRYAPHVAALILVTNRAQLAVMPATMRETPVTVVNLLGGLR